MQHESATAGRKVHPREREILPDDPMRLDVVEMPGDTDLMLRLLVEEYARLGWDAPAIIRLARDPNYQALHGLFRLLGDEAFAGRVADVVGRAGVLRVKTVEAAEEPAPEPLVQIDTIKPG